VRVAVAGVIAWLVIGALTAFWLVGMIALRSMLWLPWLSFLAALACSSALVFLQRGAR